MDKNYSFKKSVELAKAAPIGGTIPDLHHGRYAWLTKVSANTFVRPTQLCLPAPPVKIKRFFRAEAQDELARWYPHQQSPQQVYIELDCDAGELDIIYDPEVGYGIPMGVYHGRVRRYPVCGIPSPAQANRWLQAALEDAAAIVRGYTRRWDGNNHVGVLDADAQDADHALALWARELVGDADWPPRPTA